ncbi:hypothetical protein GCWU000324_00832 [Kingella oralis ATCC 51147]|uniref:Uncharacterized protein n=1 Tax=Kingella oralis ATCC 51147 TaxID=629741 RepID=C4GFB7_9NEIS|nr:hypothetical protein GCWU000324_00832 [Kingella oralis ATCC 51147]
MTTRPQILSTKPVHKSPAHRRQKTKNLVKSWLLLRLLKK